MLKLIITDIGGVLVKTDEAIISCIEKVCEEKGITGGSKENMLTTFGTSLHDYIKYYLPEEERHRTEECYERFKEIYPDSVTDLMRVFEGVNETLNYIKSKGIKIAVLSCMIRREVDVNLSLLDFKDFDIVFALDDYGDKRPMPNGLQMIMKRCEIEPHETLYIGDTINDIRMAKNAGVISAAVRTGVMSDDKLKKENPDYLLDGFKNLKEVIEKN